MSELKMLAESHNIQSSLFHTSNLAKVFALLGKKRQLDFTKESLDSDDELSDEEKWSNIIKFLEKEMKVREQISLLEKANGSYFSAEPVDNTGDDENNSYNNFLPVPVCVLCGKSENHVLTITNKGKSVINYFSCELFATSTCSERLKLLREKNLCFYLQPLYIERPH